MIVAVPVEEKSMNARVCSSFGRAPYFLVYDTQSRQGDYLENRASQARGGAGIVAAQLLVDNQVSCLITQECGAKSAQVLVGRKIKLYKAATGSAQANIAALQEDKLGLLTEIDATLKHNGSK